MFSHVWWPIFVPLAILLVEHDRRRRASIAVFQVLGLGVGLYLLYFIVRYPVVARVEGRSIFYDSPHFFIGAVLVVYFLATCVSGRSEEHTSELQSLMRISYAVFCLKKKNTIATTDYSQQTKNHKTK